MKQITLGILLTLIPLSISAKHPYFNLDEFVWETKTNEQFMGQYLRSNQKDVVLLQEEFHVVKVPIRTLTAESPARLDKYLTNPLVMHENTMINSSSNMSGFMWFFAKILGFGIMVLIGIFFLLKRELFISKLKVKL